MFGSLVTALAPFPVIAHIDSGSDRHGFSAEVPADAASRLFLTRNRVSVGWGGISVVHAMLEVVDSALANPDLLPTDVLVFVSGSCYPIASSRRINEYFNVDSHRQHCRARRILPQSTEHGWKVRSNH